MRRAGGTSPYVLRTRQVELAYLVDMYCCRIENPDGYASWSLVTENLNLHKQVSSTSVNCQSYSEVTTSPQERDTACATHHPTKGRSRYTPTPVT